MVRSKVNSTPHHSVGSFTVANSGFIRRLDDRYQGDGLFQGKRDRGVDVSTGRLECAISHDHPFRLCIV